MRRARIGAADYGDRAHPLLEDTDEADDEDDDGAHVLHDNGRVGHQRPEVVRLQVRVAGLGPCCPDPDC